jgi:hypothetical protein
MPEPHASRVRGEINQLRVLNKAEYCIYIAMNVDDCRTPFEPGWNIGRLSRHGLCVLGREWMLHGHLQDRVGMPLLLEFADREAMEAVAIDEWMGASPVYSRRIQRALGFGGDGVDTIFKNIQLDIGAPHQFLDFQFTLNDQRSGEFWLPYCGALMDVEPMGDEFVHGMCHTIEDPTFDATAGAINPLAQVRPIHRPPRVPADRVPHCHWSVIIGDGPPVVPHPNVDSVEESLSASIALAPITPDQPEPGGWADYSGDFDPGFALEDLSHQALLIALPEFAMQSHLLFRSYLLTVEQRYGAERRQGMMLRIMAGLGGLTSGRLRVAMRLERGAQGVARLLQIHPMLAPAGYVDFSVALEDDHKVRLGLKECPALAEADGFSWFAPLGDDDASLAAVAAIVQGVDPRARVHPLAPGPGERVAYSIVVSPDEEPAPEAPEIGLGKLSQGASFLFRERRPLRLA